MSLELLENLRKTKYSESKFRSTLEIEAEPGVTMYVDMSCYVIRPLHSLSVLRTNRETQRSQSESRLVSCVELLLGVVEEFQCVTNKEPRAFVQIKSLL